MIPCAFNDGNGPGIAHCKAFSGAPCGKQAPTCGAIQAGVADNGRVLAGITGPCRGGNDNGAAVHGLAHIIIGIPMQLQGYTLHAEGTKRLTGRARQFHMNAVFWQAAIPVTARNFSGQAGTNGAIDVADRIVQTGGNFVFQCRTGILDHLFSQFTLIKGRIAVLGVEVDISITQLCIGEQWQQIQTFLLFSLGSTDFQQLAGANQFIKAADAQLRHDLTGFFGHKAEIIDGHFRQTGEMLAQGFILGGNAGSAVVEMANT